MKITDCPCMSPPRRRWAVFTACSLFCLLLWAGWILGIIAFFRTF